MKYRHQSTPAAQLIGMAGRPFGQAAIWTLVAKSEWSLHMFKAVSGKRQQSARASELPCLRACLCDARLYQVPLVVPECLGDFCQSYLIPASGAATQEAESSKM